jgi:hypothetical protein
MGAVTLSPATAVVYRVLLSMARVPAGELALPWTREHGVRAREVAENGQAPIELEGGISGGQVSPRLNVLMRKGLAVNDPLTGKWAATPKEDEP